MRLIEYFFVECPKNVGRQFSDQQEDQGQTMKMQSARIFQNTGTTCCLLIL